jgi:hypothetical protein
MDASRTTGGGIVPGMSGSPILNTDGAAVGVCCTGDDGASSIAGPNPVILFNLPNWLVVDLTAPVVSAGAGASEWSAFRLNDH